MSRRFVLSTQGAICLVVWWLVTVLLAFSFSRKVMAKEVAESADYVNLKTFTDVLALVQKNYVKDVEIKDLITGAIKGMLLTLDPHSSYLLPQTYKNLQVETKGKFGGLGIEISIRDGLLTVIAPIEDSPAAKAGVLAGDQIIKIEDDFTKDLPLDEAVKKLRGPKGSKVTISVHREGANRLVPITVTRDIIRVKSIRYRVLSPGYGYVRLSQFQQRSSDEFKKAIRKLQEQSEGNELRGLVLDLRTNPGGLLTQAIKVADTFLKDGIIVYTDGRLDEQKQQYFATDDLDEPEFPLVILVNGGSASASEIVAGALQDHERAVILGEKTFGKGSVQTVLPMGSGAALRLTTALYYTKSGRSIQKQGIFPDIEVSQVDKSQEVEAKEEEKISSSGAIKEKDLPGALEGKDKSEDRVTIGSREAMSSDLDRLLRSDRQLSEALKLLKTWQVFKGSGTGPTTEVFPSDSGA